MESGRSTGQESRPGCVLVDLEEFLDWAHSKGIEVKLRRLRGRVEIADEVCSEVIRKYFYRPFPSRLSLIPRFAMGLARASLVNTRRAAKRQTIAEGSRTHPREDRSG